MGAKNIDNIQRLIYLCQIKNDLNRKRRRFYYYWNKPKLTRKCIRKHECPNLLNPSQWSCRGEHQWESGPKHITVSEAKAGYLKAQREMKLMTSDMRKMRVEMGVSFKWNAGGLIEAIVFADNKRLSQKLFKKYYEAEVFELELFGSKGK